MQPPLGFDDAPTPPLPDPEELLAELNPPQRDAVLACDGPVLILAGAGSGKTRAITTKIAWLVRRLDFQPWEILAVTFTNKAASEMRERVGRMLGAAADDLWMGTFHSIGVRMLRRHADLLGMSRSFVIYDSDDQKAMVRRTMEALNVSEKTYAPKALQGYINNAKQNCLEPGSPELPYDGHLEELGFKVYGAYAERMREAGAVDFADLIYLPWKLLSERPMIASEYKQRWRYVLVDEFQDTNRAQYQLLQAALNDASRICVVGDDDQSIYRWRGADVGNILGFETDFPGATVVRLEQNYRSSEAILDVAGALIAKNCDRHAKRLWTDRDAGEPVRCAEVRGDIDEAQYVARRIVALRGRYDLREMAIFYRTNAQSRVLEDVMRRRNIPYKIVGGLKFYARAEVKDILAYLRVVQNPSDEIGLERIINRPTRGIGKGTLGQVKTHATQRGQSFWDALVEVSMTGRQGVQNKLQPFVRLVRGFQRLGEVSSAYAVAVEVVEKTGYLDKLEQENNAEADARAENVRELLSAIREHGETTGDKGLQAYLEQVALVADIDGADFDGDSIVMMTVHNAKGLEFDVVFLTGLEEGLLPHANSSDSEAGIAEERRLAYVGVTRARHVLHLTHAQTRRRYGSPSPQAPSRFFDGLPTERLVWDERQDSYRNALPRHRSQPLVTRQPRNPGWEVAQEMPNYEDFSQDTPDRLGPGSRVFHVQFGEGEVQRVSGSGQKAIVHANFGGAQKRIVAKFLTPLG